MKQPLVSLDITALAFCLTFGWCRYAVDHDQLLRAGSRSGRMPSGGGWY